MQQNRNVNVQLESEGRVLQFKIDAGGLKITASVRGDHGAVLLTREECLVLSRLLREELRPDELQAESVEWHRYMEEINRLRTAGMATR